MVRREERGGGREEGGESWIFGGKLKKSQKIYFQAVVGVK